MTDLSDTIEQNKRLAATLVSPPARPRLTSPSVTGRDFSGGGGGGGEKKDKGILGGIASIIPSAIGEIGRGVAAIPQFVGKVGQTAVGAGEWILDAGTDLISQDLYKSRFETDWEKGGELGLTGFDRFVYANQRQTPLFSMIAPGLVETGKHVAEAGTAGMLDFGEPGLDYARAFREGNLGAMLVQDIGNVILLGRATGAGNVVGRAGAAIGETAPRLGRAVSTVGRVIEEPVGETVRQTGRLVGAGAERAGMTGLSEAARRVYYDIDAQAPTSRPIRVLVNQVGEKYRSMNEAAANELFRQAADLSDQAVALRDTDPMRSSQLQAEADIALQKAQDKVVGTGVVRAGRKIAYRMALASERSTQRLVNEFRRVDQYGSVPDSVADLRKSAERFRKASTKEGVDPARAQQLVATALELERRAAIKERYPEFFDQELQPWVAGAATLLHIGLGRYARVLSERGFSDQDIAIAFQRPDIIPTLENKAMKVTPEMVKAAREYDAYQRGNMQAMNEGAALAVQGYLELVQAAAESFSDAVRRGFGIPTGALPASFFSFFPEPTFLLGAINTWPTEIQAAASRLLDYVVAETLIEMVRAKVMQLDDLKELGIDPVQFQRAIEEAIPEESTSNPYRGYYAKMVKAGPGSQGYEIASIAVENAYPKLRQIAPEQMMNKNIYPAATTRPAVEAAEQVVRMATADDVATMRDSLIALVNEFQNDMPKQLVEGALRDIEKSFQPGVPVTKTAYVRMEKRLATILANAERTLAKIRSGEMKVVGELDQITLEFARAIDALTRAREMVRILGEEPVQVIGQTAVRQAEAEVRTAEEQLAVKEAQLRGLEEVARQEEAVYAITQPIGRLKRVRETTTETVAEPAPEPIVEPAPAPIAEPTPEGVVPEGATVVQPEKLYDDEPDVGQVAITTPEGLEVSKANPHKLTKKQSESMFRRAFKFGKGGKASAAPYEFDTDGGGTWVGNNYAIIESYPTRGFDVEDVLTRPYGTDVNFAAVIERSIYPTWNSPETQLRIVAIIDDTRPKSVIKKYIVFQRQDGSFLAADADYFATFLPSYNLEYFQKDARSPILVDSGLGVPSGIIGFIAPLQRLPDGVEITSLTGVGPVLAPKPTVARPAPEPTLRTVTRTTTRMKPVTEPPARFPAGREIARRLSQAKDEVRKAQSEVTAARRMLTKATERVGKQQRQEVTARLKGVGYLKEGEPVLRKDVERRLEDTTEQLANKEVNRQNKLQDLKEQEARAEGYATAAEAEATIARQRDEATGPDNPIGPELFDPETDVIGYFPMGPTRGMLPKSEIQTQLLGEGMGAQNEPSFVRIRRGGGFVLTAADTANKFSEIMKQMFHNEAVETVLRDPNITKSAVAELGEGWFALNEEAARQAVLRQEANRLRTPDEIERAVQTELGVMAIRELRRRGYEPVSPAKIDPETGGHAAVGTLDRVVTPADMDRNTIIMRIGVKERLSSDYVKKGARNVPSGIEWILDKLQRGTSRWKSVILPMSLRWQIGDAVSNVMNAWLRGGISPAELLRYSKEVTRRLMDPNDASIANLLFGDLLDQAMRDPVMSAVFGSGLEGRGNRLQEVLFTGRNADRVLATIADPRARTIAGQYFNQFRAKAFRLNEAHNSIARAAVALKNLEDNLAKVGRTVDEINGVSALKDPVIQKAIEDAVSTTNNILGAFSDLTPWEKSVMRQIFPFWSWVKFINKAAMEIAIDSPDRVLFYAHLGSMASDPDQNGFLDFLRGKTPVGPWLMDLSFMNPYSDALIFEGNPLSATAEQFTSFSPAITVPLRMLGEAAYGATGREFPFLPVASRPGYLEGRLGATTRDLGDVLGGMAYIGLKGVGGPFRNVLEVLPTGTIPGTDIATGPGPRFPQGSLRTTGAYAEPRLSGITERVSSVLRTFGIPGPIAEVDIARRQAEEQAQRDAAAKKRREKERANK